MNDMAPPQLSSLVDDYKPDILDTISNLSNDEVFTPPALANRVLDLLPAEIWSDPDIRVLDPFCKTGIFLREAAKRFMAGLEDVIPDEAERRRHIFRNQLYGCAITELTWLMSRRSLYGTKDASSWVADRLTVKMDRPEGNIIFPRREHDWDKNGKCRICGIGNEIEREGRENHAYALIHGGIEEEFADVQFDVIIGNPPYQVKSDGGTRDLPIYNLFVEAAKEMKPRFLSMIIPSRWMAGGLGLSDFRKSMLTDRSVSKMIDYPNSKDAFPGVDVKGGVCFFVREDGYSGDCQVSQVRGEWTSEPRMRSLGEHDVFVRDSRSISILQKVIESKGFNPITDILSVDKEFGWTSNFTGFHDVPNVGDVPLYYNRKGKRLRGWIARSNINKSVELVDKWKVMIPSAGSGGGTVPDAVLSHPFITPSPSVCTQTYLFLHFDTEEAAQSAETYVKTRFFRFLVSLRKITQHGTRSTYSWVPIQKWDCVWTDERLYEMFGITAEEQAFINSMIREM